MAIPNRRHLPINPMHPGQTPPIFDRSQMPQQSPNMPGGGWHPAQGVPQPSPYHGYGIANMFQRFGNQYDVGSSTPTGGFGFDAGQKSALAPLLQQLPGLISGSHQPIVGGGGDLRNPNPTQMDTSGGVLKALKSLGVDVGDTQGFGFQGDQRAQFMHSLQQFVNGLGNRGGAPNRRHGSWTYDPLPGQTPPIPFPGY